MKKNEKIIIINADLAKAAGLTELTNKFRSRCFNVGVAEQNMAGIAAGISSYGFIPFIFTFTPFATRRICDQIAVSICYAGQNVKIFGLDPGISAESNGGTHMSFEDIGVIRSIPNITIFEPCDAIQFKSSLTYISDYPKTIYVRMYRKKLPKIFDDNYNFDPSCSDILRHGNDISIFCSGIMVEESLRACDILKKENINAEIINIHTIKPIDKKSIIKSVRKTRCAITAENHNKLGGLFSAVSEVLSENIPTHVSCVAVDDEFGQVGNLNFLKKYYGLTAEKIVFKAMDLVRKKS
ncbi:MAG: transketolase family protein [Firmicutes bacterium]|nr:transketolase family protein [Bacillota bacterium]